MTVSPGWQPAWRRGRRDRRTDASARVAPWLPAAGTHLDDVAIETGAVHLPRLLLLRGVCDHVRDQGGDHQKPGSPRGYNLRETETEWARPAHTSPRVFPSTSASPPLSRSSPTANGAHRRRTTRRAHSNRCRRWTAHCLPWHPRLWGTEGVGVFFWDSQPALGARRSTPALCPLCDTRRLARRPNLGPLLNHATTPHRPKTLYLWEKKVAGPGLFFFLHTAVY
jgi:hypothetical protein